MPLHRIEPPTSTTGLGTSAPTIQKLRNLRDHLRTWLDRYRKAGEAVPSIQRAFELIEWQLGALEQRPEEARVIPDHQVQERVDLTCNIVPTAVPMLPEVDRSALPFATEVTSTGSSNVVYTYVTQVGGLKYPETQKYAEVHTKAYQELQVSQNRPNQVRKLLKKLLPTKSDQFDLAFDAYYAAKSGAGERSAAALQMGVLLDQIKGELWKGVFRTPTEKSSWKKIFKRLQLDPVRKDELIRQAETLEAIYDDLTAIQKHREGSHPKSLDNLWTRWLDHLYVILNLIPGSAV